MRVDFAFGAADRVAQAARTTLRQATKGVRVFAYCTDTKRLGQFDQALWAVDDTAFVAHEMFNDRATPNLPVYLVDQAGWAFLPKAIKPEDWLLNLDDECPPLFDGLRRVLEIVSNEDSDRQRARSRWRQYQQHGADLHAHKLA